jgi:hypothetical protein
MIRIIDHPSIVFLVSLFVQWGAAYAGDVFRRWRPIGKNEREDFNTVLTATLTLLALLISFSFSMAVSRYLSAFRQTGHRAHIAERPSLTLSGRSALV